MLLIKPLSLYLNDVDLLFDAAYYSKAAARALPSFVVGKTQPRGSQGFKEYQVAVYLVCWVSRRPCHAQVFMFNVQLLFLHTYDLPNLKVRIGRLPNELRSQQTANQNQSEQDYSY